MDYTNNNLTFFYWIDLYLNDTVYCIYANKGSSIG